MPAGDDRESLMESYPVVMNFVRDRGWRFTGRSHIMAFNTERCVQERSVRNFRRN